MEGLEYFAGVDWGSETHQVCIVDGEGAVLRERAFWHGGAGLAEMADWLVATANAEPHAIGVAIEIPHGPVVETLMERGFAVHSLNQDMPTTPVANAIEPTYMRPLGEGRWLLGRGFPKPYFDVDPYNFKESVDNDFSVEALDLMTKRVPPLQGARLLGGYAALYDVTPDWAPFFGPRAGLEGYYDACGGSGHAFKTGPMLARELAEWILEGSAKDDYRQLSYDRVVNDNLFKTTFGGNRQ